MDIADLSSVVTPGLGNRAHALLNRSPDLLNRAHALLN